MDKERNRILRFGENIIITNYKCMFSSLNNLKICELNPKDKENYKKIFLWRNPIDRTISCFLNWFISHPQKKKIFTELNHLIILKKRKKIYIKELNWLPNILINSRDFNLEKYKILLKNNEIIELFKLYLDILPKIKDRNGHLHSQIKIIENNNFTIDKFINIDIPNEIKELENIINQEIPVRNASKKENKLLIKNFLKENPKYNKIIYEIYKDDYLFFSLKI